MSNALCTVLHICRCTYATDEVCFFLFKRSDLRVKKTKKINKGKGNLPERQWLILWRRLCIVSIVVYEGWAKKKKVTRSWNRGCKPCEDDWDQIIWKATEELLCHCSMTVAVSCNCFWFDFVINLKEKKCIAATSGYRIV